MGLMKNLGIANKGGDRGLMRIKELFFDRRAVLDSLGRAQAKAFPRFGAFVMRTARKSIKNPRRLRLGDMTKEQRRKYRIAAAIAKKKGLRPPKRPFSDESSRPGQPPINRTGKLKSKILFHYDRFKRSVIIGPYAFSPNKAHVLEHGGTTQITFGPNRGRAARVAARPFMGPALAEENRKNPLAEMLRDSMRP